MLSVNGVTSLVSALKLIQGASFGAIDAETNPKPGITKVTKNQQVLLLGSAVEYEAIIKRRLAEAGRNPDDFVVSELPWGQHVEGSPLVTHNGRLYVQCIILQPGGIEYIRKTPFGDRPVNPKEYGIKERQGVAGTDLVVSTYNLDNVTRFAIGGSVFT